MNIIKKLNFIYTDGIIIYINNIEYLNNIIIEYLNIL